MDRRIIYALVAVIILMSGFNACTKNKAEEKIPESGDSILVVKKIFHPLVIDSNSINDFLIHYPLFKFHSEEIKTFYANRNDRSAWFNDYGLVEQAGLFMNQLDHFDDQGIKDSVIYATDLKKTYHIISDVNYSYSGADSLTSQFELLLTAEFFVYAQKVWFGLSEKKTKELDWYIKRSTVPSVSILDSILAGGSNSYMAFEPQYPQYKLLKAQLIKYRQLAETEKWDSIRMPVGKKSLKLGDSALIIRDIKHRLYVLGDMTDIDSSIVFSDSLQAAVKRFQLRHGLDDDGAAGPNFFKQINVTIQDRVRQLELNMERCRWIPAVDADNYIIVNIPEYKMHIYDGDTLSWNMNVVVGKTTTGTAIFNDELEYIVFSPYWIPPPSILNNEILPALKKNPNYLAKENMEAYDPSTNKTINVSGVDWSKYTSMPYRVRQKPGGSNSLGWVKFLFPNEYSIYFHDTPSRNLFSQSQRNFSHGCIRLQEPKKFAEYLLRNDTTFTAKEIDSLYYLGKETYVKLKEPIPVYLVYFTAWVDESGQLNFRKDIYGHDIKLEKTLYDSGASDETPQ